MISAILSLTLAQRFALQFGAGLIVGAWLLYWVARWRGAAQPWRWLDVYLGAILCALIGGRLLYVLRHADLFWAEPLKVFGLWYGGLMWQGALSGSLIGAYGLCHWRGVDWRAFSDAAALALPVILMGLFWAGRDVGLMIGARVADLNSVPTWTASHLRDLNGLVQPRYELQLLGLVVAWLLLLTLTFLMGRGWLKGALLGLGLGWLGLLIFLMASLGESNQRPLEQISAGLVIAFSALLLRGKGFIKA